MKHKTVDGYISSFPSNTSSILNELRELVKKTVPEAKESISYQMPAYSLYGKPLVYFAGYANHIGMYALPSGHQNFMEELSLYKQGKGSVQFPLSQPLPMALIEKIILFRAEENRLLYHSKVKSKKNIELRNDHPVS